MVEHEKEEAWWFACLLIEQPANCLIVVVKPEKALILTETTPADYVAARPSPVGTDSDVMLMRSLR